MDIIKRSAWGAKPARPRTRVDDSSRDAFFLHYTTGEELGRTDTAEWVREIQRYHQSKGWADIGYSWLVDATGRIFEGRGWEYQTAAADGWNTRGWHVAFLGDDDRGRRDITPAARASIRLLFEVAKTRAGHELEPMGHRDGNPDTECPGDEGEAFVRSGFTLGVPEPRRPRRRRRRRPRPRLVPGPTGVGAPAWPLGLDEYWGPGGRTSGPNLKRWQDRMADRGWDIEPDGIYGPETREVAEEFQREKGLRVDGLIGRATWAAAWSAPIT